MFPGVSSKTETYREGHKKHFHQKHLKISAQHWALGRSPSNTSTSTTCSTGMAVGAQTDLPTGAFLIEPGGRRRGGVESILWLQAKATGREKSGG